MITPDFRKTEILYTENEEKFSAFSALLKEYNQKFNLTSITADEEIKYKHFYDSLYGAELFGKNARVAEIGSGGGFPSIPLKIARPDLSFTLIESTGKKCEFLKIVVKELSLDGVEIVNARAEEIAKDLRYREAFDVCCARAVARLNTLAEYCLPFVKKGGSFITYKGDGEEELAEAKKALQILGGGEVRSVSYDLPEGYGKRRLIAVTKEKNTPALYPRGHGKERTKPL